MDQRLTAAEETEGVWLKGRGAEGFLEFVTPELRLEYKSDYPRTGVGMGVSRGTWQMRTTAPPEMAPCLSVGTRGQDQGTGLGLGQSVWWEREGLGVH